jgi:outer membrane protein assembly factor BamA
LYTLELKQYLNFIENQVLACQMYGGFVAGTAPFQYRQRFGGEKLMRGYLEGRFLDNDYVLAQAEYRFPVWWRFGMVVFGGLGQVSSSPSALSLAEFKTSIGVGVRYAISPEEKLNIRVDFGFGQDGNSGFYLTAAEAF